MAELPQGLSRSFLARIIDAVADPIFVKDEEHRWILLNDAMCSFMGRPREQLLGRSDFDFFPPEEATVFWRKDAEVFATGVPNVNVESLTDAAGVPHTISTKKALFQGDDGRKVLVGIIRDVTQQQTLERQLITAREEALQAASAKAAFLASMSHELRTPMNGVIGMTELLLGTGLGPEQRELATMLRRSGEYLLTIINAILEFSKLEAGAVRLERRDFNLREVVELVMGLVAPSAQEKGLELACFVAREVPAIVGGDPERLSEVLFNLLGNALKFTDAGSVSLRVTLAERRDDGVCLRMEVGDTGVGFQPSDVERIFVAFTQLDSSAARRHGGTGLGLSISRQLVEMMGGRIEVQSAPGRGSVFAVTVPLARPSEGASEGAPPEAPWCARALLVDGRPLHAAFLVEQLGAHGVTVEQAPVGSDVCALLRRARAAGAAPDVLFLDLEALERDPALLPRLRAEGELAALPVILLSPLGRTGDARLTPPPGPVRSLTRPVAESKLLAALHFFDQRRAASSAPDAPRPPPARGAVGPLQRVLVAEDNPVNQRVLEKMLEVLGYRADVVGDGQEALAALARTPFDVVLMDCHMPGVDGYQAAAQLRRRERGPRVPIIAMTASASEADRRRCMDAGMDDYLSKPVRLEHLGERLERWLGRRAEG